MIGKNIAITVATLAMMSQATVAIAAGRPTAAGFTAAGRAASTTPSVSTSLSDAASLTGTATGLASNRAALGMPIAASAPCAPSDGIRIACLPAAGSSEFAKGGSGIFVLLAAIAAIGLGIAAAASGNGSPNSP